MWRATAAGSYGIVFLRDYPAGWEIAGISDGNADGRSDIHWYNPTLHRLQVWYMAGATWVSAAPHATSATARILGIGDSSADGRAGLAWHDKATAPGAVGVRV